MYCSALALALLSILIRVGIENRLRVEFEKEDRPSVSGPVHISNILAGIAGFGLLIPELKFAWFEPFLGIALGMALTLLHVLLFANSKFEQFISAFSGVAAFVMALALIF